MRLAIVCDDLIQFGGAERVALAMSETFPGAPVYVSAASREWKEICKKRGIELHTSFMQKLPFVHKLYRYYSAFFLNCIAFESFDFTGYDIVISLSSRFAHGIITKPQTTHVCYMHSPGRMLWESESYFENESYGWLKPLKKIAFPFLSVFLSIMRIWDYSAAQRVDVFLANSVNTQKRIKKYYGADSTVIHPFTELESSVKSEVNVAESDYYLLITRLQPWKRVDVAVEACSRLNVPLKVVGTGPDMDRLKSFSSDCIQFLGYVPEEYKKSLLRNSRALIQTQKEDFGIVAVEALSFGKPVIAFGEGGAVEIVEQGVTGVFFQEQSVESLKRVLESFSRDLFLPESCIKSAEKFSKENFRKNIQDFINNVY